MCVEPDRFFLVTSFTAEERPAAERLEQYRRRGTFEDRLGEFRQWIGPKLSSQAFESNEATLLLALLAFNLANMLRCELEDKAGACWDLGRFQKSVLKAGGRIVKGARQLFVDLAQADGYFAGLGGGELEAGEKAVGGERAVALQPRKQGGGGMPGVARPTIDAKVRIESGEFGVILPRRCAYLDALRHGNILPEQRGACSRRRTFVHLQK